MKITVAGHAQKPHTHDAQDWRRRRARSGRVKAGRWRVGIRESGWCKAGGSAGGLQNEGNADRAAPEVPPLR